MAKPIKPALRYTGRQEAAKYHVMLVDEESGSPFREALPERLPDRQAIIDYMTVVPPISKNELHLPSELRMERANLLDRFLLPSDYHVQVYRIVNQLIRGRYEG